MPRYLLSVLISLFLFALTHPGNCCAQEADEFSKPFSRLGIAIKASSLGAGIEAATPLTYRSNLRVGFNVFSYDRGFNKDGISYAGRLRFLSTDAHYDWFPFGGSFHLSPGVLVYNGNQITANASVPAGNTFTLNNTTYTSDPTGPITGTGNVDFVKAGPMFTVGWENLLPRNHRRFSVPFEVGFVYTGSPRAALNIEGSACDASGLFCQSVRSDPTFQANVQSEKDKLDRDMSAFKFYPVISIGFGFSF